VESAIAGALEGVSNHDRRAAIRMLGRLADYLEPSASRERESHPVRHLPPVAQSPGGHLRA
jgi:hypothetical protein